MTRPMPATVGAAFTHAVGQWAAEEAGVDLLHIKGAAVHRDLLPRVPGIVAHGMQSSEHSRASRPSTDADLWVRPSQVRPFVQTLRHHGWSVAYSFTEGSPFRHAMTLRHPVLSPLDLHRWFPGIRSDPEEAFEILWRNREMASIAGCPCAVPSVTAQRLVLILHAARARVASDIELAWHSATEAEKLDVMALARRLDCQVPVAAAVGELENFRDRPDYALWKAIRDGESSLPAMWLARVRAEPTPTRRIGTAFALLAPKPARLQSTLGRKPTAAETAREYVRMVKRASADVFRSISPGRRGGSR